MFKSRASRVLRASILPAAKLSQIVLTWYVLDAWIFVVNKKHKDIGNIKNIVEDGIDGYLVKNKDEWYNRLIELIDNHKLRDKIGKMAREKVEKEYSVEILSKKYLKIFNNLT